MYDAMPDAQPGRKTDSVGDMARGQWVEVKSIAEIAATLDAEGRLDGLPFMPEMTRFCGRRLKIYRRADKTCVEGYGLRRMRDTVLLEESRCDGAAHDGCERNCMMFWKTAWLKPADLEPSRPPIGLPANDLANLPTRDGARYICQSTALGEATAPLSKFDLRHLLADLRRGEITAPRLAGIVVRTGLNIIRRKFGLPELEGLRGPGSMRRRGRLDLQAGDWVRVKSAEAIAATLDAEGKNLGLAFEPEMKRYAGGVFQVEFPVRKIIQEETGLMSLLTGTVALRGLACQGICVRNCPRANTLYWREIWLERVAAQIESRRRRGLAPPTSQRWAPFSAPARSGVAWPANRSAAARTRRGTGQLCTMRRSASSRADIRSPFEIVRTITVQFPQSWQVFAHQTVDARISITRSADGRTRPRKEKFSRDQKSVTRAANRPLRANPGRLSRPWREACRADRGGRRAVPQGDTEMGMSIQEANTRALKEARLRRRRDGRQAPDRCIDEYLALSASHPRRQELTRVIAVLTLM